MLAVNGFADAATFEGGNRSIRRIVVTARVGGVVGLGVGSRLTLLQLDIQKKWESSQGVPVESGWSAQLPVSYKGSLFPMYQRQHADGKLVPTYVLHKS